MFTYQKNKRFFAQVADGLEEPASLELHELGAFDIKPGFRGVYFSAELPDLYRINYCTRLCTRILAPLLTFDCHSPKYLYSTARRLDWQQFLDNEKTFAVFATTSNSHIKHSQHAALTLKDAVVDYFRDATGKRPDVNTDNPDIWLNLHIERNRATISLDTSGGSLHRRGYRLDSIQAPMQETLAAAIIQLSDWNGQTPIYDPMCGSGTLLAEAMMRYCRIPAAYLRMHFGFEHLPDFNREEWRKVRDKANQQIRELPDGLICGSDKDQRAIAMAARNLERLPQGKSVALHSAAFENLAGLKDKVIVCNPPYGVRLGDKEEAAELIEEFGNFLKRKCTGSQAYLYLGARELVKKVGLKPTWKKPLKNGGLDGLLTRYDLY